MMMTMFVMHGFVVCSGGGGGKLAGIGSDASYRPGGGGGGSGGLGVNINAAEVTAQLSEVSKNAMVRALPFLLQPLSLDASVLMTAAVPAPLLYHRVAAQQSFLSSTVATLSDKVQKVQLGAREGPHQGGGQAPPSYGDNIDPVSAAPWLLPPFALLSVCARACLSLSLSCVRMSNVCVPAVLCMHPPLFDRGPAPAAPADPPYAGGSAGALRGPSRGGPVAGPLYAEGTRQGLDRARPVLGLASVVRARPCP